MQPTYYTNRYRKDFFMNYSGKMLEIVIKKNKISVAKLARLINVSRSTIYHWYKQESLPLETVHEIAYVIGYDILTYFQNSYVNQQGKDGAAGPVANAVYTLPKIEEQSTEQKYVMLLSELMAIIDGNDAKEAEKINKLRNQIKHLLDTESKAQ